MTVVRARLTIGPFERKKRYYAGSGGARFLVAPLADGPKWFFLILIPLALAIAFAGFFGAESDRLACQ